MSKAFDLMSPLLGRDMSPVEICSSFLLRLGEMHKSYTFMSKVPKVCTEEEKRGKLRIRDLLPFVVVRQTVSGAASLNSNKAKKALKIWSSCRLWVDCCLGVELLSTSLLQIGP